MNHNFTSDTTTKTLNITHYIIMVIKIHMLHTRVHTHTHTHTNTNKQAHACIHTCRHAHIDIYVYTQRGRHAQTSHLAMDIPTHKDGSGHWLYIRLLQQKITHPTQFFKREEGTRKAWKEGWKEGGMEGGEGRREGERERGKGVSELGSGGSE